MIENAELGVCGFGLRVWRVWILGVRSSVLGIRLWGFRGWRLS